MSDGPDDSRPLIDVVRESLDMFSSVERKVARALLANYPIAGLETVAELAERSNVSPSSVVRFVGRLGFAGYPAFQKKLMREVHERLGSPLEQYGRTDLSLGDGDLAHAARHFSAVVATTLTDLPRSEFDRCVELLSDQRRPVRLIGGRFSRILAEYLGAHLQLLRPDVEVLGIDEFARFAAVSDAGRDDIFVLFDYRRYDSSSVRFAQRVSGRGADLILFTDRWMSPAADVATTVLPANVESPSPFDSLVPAMALVEAVIAGATERLGETGRRRLEVIERMRGEG